MLNCLQNNKSCKDMYVQCTLEKQVGSATHHRTIWGNSDKAIVGNTVKVEENDGSWTTDWIVKQVHGKAKPRSWVQHQSHAHTRQRSASDI
jgi:hypothetical protein